MRWLAAQLTSSLCRRKHLNFPACNFSKMTRKEEIAIEKVAIESALKYYVSLLNAKDPMSKEWGAYHLSRNCPTDEFRMKIVGMGGAEGLVKMLDSAEDDKVKYVALKALDALSASDEAVAAMYHAGAISAIRSILDSPDNVEAMQYKSNLLKRFQDLKYDL